MSTDVNFELLIGVAFVSQGLFLVKYSDGHPQLMYKMKTERKITI